MPRVKRGIIHTKRRKNLLKKTKGYMWGRKNLIRAASTAVLKAGARAYTDRKKKKRNTRALWNIKINAFIREHGLNYSQFINALKESNVQLDRKILADLAVNNKQILARVIDTVKK